MADSYADRGRVVVIRSKGWRGVLMMRPCLLGRALWVSYVLLLGNIETLGFVAS